jgi:hypothetical protein
VRNRLDYVGNNPNRPIRMDIAPKFSRAMSHVSIELTTFRHLLRPIVLENFLASLFAVKTSNITCRKIIIMKKFMRLQGSFPFGRSCRSGPVSVSCPLPWVLVTFFLAAFLHRLNSFFHLTSILKMEVVCFTETVASTYTTTRCYNYNLCLIMRRELELSVSVGLSVVSKIAAGLQQQSESRFRVPSGPMAIFLFFPKFLHVLKRELLYNERKVLTTSGHCPSTEGDANSDCLRMC